MKYEWLNDGEPDENGDYIAVIENATGGRISTFKGKTYKEVADALLQSQANANREISRLRRPDRARIPQPFKAETTELTPADKLRLSNDITDPNKVVDAVTEIVTHAQGASPREITTRLAMMTDEQRDQYYKDEAVAFVQATPDYYPVQQNRDKLFGALKDNLLDLTRNNLQLVYQTLSDQGELIAWPDEPTDGPTKPNGQQREARPSPEPNSPSPTSTSRPRSVATGIRNSDASASAPPPPTPKKITRADIERMSRAEYQERLRDPAFKKAVDALGA
jgi:hypothetical protein